MSFLRLLERADDVGVDEPPRVRGLVRARGAGKAGGVGLRAVLARELVRLGDVPRGVYRVSAQLPEVGQANVETAMERGRHVVGRERADVRPGPGRMNAALERTTASGGKDAHASPRDGAVGSAAPVCTAVGTGCGSRR